MTRIFESLHRRFGPASVPTTADYGYLLEGPFESLPEAASLCEGYDSIAILTAVESSMAAVRSGEAVMERDGVALQNSERPLPLIAACLRQALKDKGSLRVLDFGGSLGSSYRACESWLRELSEVKWGIVEQPLFVSRGQAKHGSENLLFFNSISDCFESINPNLVLLSSVLMYLDKPWDTLKDLISTRATTMVVDRTLLSSSTESLIYVERVNMPAYSASYPCQCLSKPTLTSYLSQDYTILQEFQPIDIVPLQFSHLTFWGAILERKS